ncbi:MAG: SEC-C metal-binding domain-containing protein [Actinomycetota bacterium]|nr:SEC-C metal-binding domain-containing protein [Actinomycetota bacterium]
MAQIAPAERSSVGQPAAIGLRSGPSTVGTKQALLLGFWSFGHLLGLIYEEFELDGKQEVEAAFVSGLQVLHELSDDERRTTGRNDPCPCGSGKKFKACHLRQ